jgi:hypothetical protein
MKTMLFLRARPAVARGEFQDWVLRCYTPMAMRAVTGLQRLAVDTVIDPPPGIAYRPASDPASRAGADARPACDVVLQVWGETPAQCGPWLAGASAELDALVETRQAYAVTETVVWDREGAATGALPGLKYLAILDFHDDLPDSAARRSWSLHAALARRVHVGCTRYAQNWIDEALVPGIAPARGIPELYFPSESELLHRFFDSPRGREEVLHETQHFIRSGPRLYAREHVLRA